MGDQMGAIYGRRCVKLLLVVALFCSGAVRANGQGTIGEFISIDCGSSASYTDSLGLYWTNDSGYIPIGENGVVTTTYANLGGDQSQNIRKLSTIRYFPQVRKKYCYVIPEALDKTVYLIRAMFLGANFTSSQNQNASFRLTINNYDWTEVTISDSYTPVIKEVTYTTKASTFSFCLVRGVGTPFISSLELRALRSGYYEGSITSLALTTIVRWNCGMPPTNASVRYPDDQFDRLWAPDPPSLQFNRFSNYSATIYNTSDSLSPPIKALQSAWTAPLTGNLEIVWPVPSGFYILFLVLYFAEIAPVPKNGARKVNAYIDNALLQAQPIPVTSSVSVAFNYTATIAATTNIVVSPAAGSTLGPILNALELYNVSLFNDSYITWQPDVGALTVIQQSFNLTDWTGDPCWPYPWDWIECTSPNVTLVSRIQQINLSYYNISGTIPADIILLTGLQILSLDHNFLTGDISNLALANNLEKLQLESNNFQGSIPSSLAQLQYLVLLDLDNNNLTGDIPQALLTKIQQSDLTFSAAGNPYLCVGGNSTCISSPPSSPPSNVTDSGTKSNKSSSTAAIVGGAVGGVVALLLLAGVLLYYCIRRPSPQKVDSAVCPPGPKPGSVQKEHPNQGRYFSLDEVKAATNNFAKVIGKGGFGIVYYGKLHDGQEVAVKVNKGNSTNGQGTAEFFNEVALLSRVHHRNLVSLVGYCDDPDHQILIYSYMSEGTLRQHLYGESQIGIQLDWKTRLDIALNSARGLEYLHHSCSPPIIHRDVKSSNILLTHKLLAKVADFGISKITTDDDRTRGVTTLIKGTHGYLDPEYFMEQRLTTKSDVYSFGIVLLELVTGRKPNTASFPGSTAITLTEWVRQSSREGNIHAIIDPQLGGSYNLESVWKVVELALLSLDKQGVSRPDMPDVVRDLTKALEFQTQYVSTPITDHSPSNLSPGDFDQYQRIHHATRDSNDSVATYSWGSNSNMSGR
ncbi:unnamed protein product [Calypogeia fissa]